MNGQDRRDPMLRRFTDVYRDEWLTSIDKYHIGDGHHNMQLQAEPSPPPLPKAPTRSYPSSQWANTQTSQTLPPI
jgi:hypothetical protein